MSTATYHLDDDLQQRAYDAHLMRRLITYVRPYRKWMFTAGAILLVVAVISNYTPVLIKQAVDSYINNPERAALEAAGAPAEQIAAQTQKDVSGLLNVCFLIAGLVLAEAVLRYVQIVMISWVGNRTMMEMRIQLFEHLQTLSLRFLDRNPVGRLMSRVTNDVEKIQQTIVSGVVDVIADLLTVVVVLSYMFYLNWQLALVVMVPVPFVFISSMIFRKHARKSFLEIRRKVATLSAFLQESITGMRLIQIFNRQDATYVEHADKNADHRDEWLTQVRNFAIYFPVVEFLGAFSTALIILYCGISIVGTHNTASIGTIFMYLFWAERFFGPVRAMADRYNLLLEAMASSERVFQLLDTEPDITDKPNAYAPAALKGEVEFRNVWFAYEGENWVIRDLSFKIAPGERVAIVGHTGAGKSTIINLLSRFYDIHRGQILIDGVDVRDFDQVALRRNIGIVLQDVFLFNGTIEENIRLGNTDMAEATVRQCAEHVNAARFINKMPGGYAYNVGERGCNLSTGQRQLLAFARTLAHHPNVLILDEATSSVDTETEALIQDATEKLMEGRTSIVIAHRLSTIQHADRILVMHHAELRESGTHQELVSRPGLYRTLYELQYKDQAVAPTQG